MPPVKRAWSKPCAHQVLGDRCITLHHADGLGIQVLRNQTRDERRGGRRQLRRLDHHAVSGGDRGHHRRHAQIEGVIPRPDHQDHAQRVVLHPCLTGQLRQRKPIPLRLHPLLQVLTREGGFGLRRADIAQPGLERGPAQIAGQRLGDLRLTLLTHLLHGTQLLGTPRQRPGAAGVEHPAHVGQHAGGTPLGGLVTCDLDGHANSSNRSRDSSLPHKRGAVAWPGNLVTILHVTAIWPRAAQLSSCPMATVANREAYFETGLEVLADVGYGGLKLAEVCNRLGVTTGSFLPLLLQLAGLHPRPGVLLGPGPHGSPDQRHPRGVRPSSAHRGDHPGRPVPAAWSRGRHPFVELGGPARAGGAVRGRPAASQDPLRLRRSKSSTMLARPMSTPPGRSTSSSGTSKPRCRASRGCSVGSPATCSTRWTRAVSPACRGEPGCPVAAGGRADPDT